MGYVNGSALLFLRELSRRGATLNFRNRPVVGLGLAHGFHFARPAAAGPDPEGSGPKNAEDDALAICMGDDRRLILMHSFTSFGVPHKWLLLELGASNAEENTEVFAADLCCGSLGLLGKDAVELLRVWNVTEDHDRFVPLC